ncbi:MAG: hypothetical protein AAF581_19080 [Planctomycetota bacterium]
MVWLQRGSLIGAVVVIASAVSGCQRDEAPAAAPQRPAVSPAALTKPHLAATESPDVVIDIFPGKNRTAGQEGSQETEPSSGRTIRVGGVAMNRIELTEHLRQLAATFATRAPGSDPEPVSTIRALLRVSPQTPSKSIQQVFRACRDAKIFDLRFSALPDDVTQQ